MNTWIFRGWKDETRTSKDWPALSSLAALSRLARRPPTSACGNPWGFFNFERDSLISTWGEDPSPRTWRFGSEDLPPHPDSPIFFFALPWSGVYSHRPFLERGCLWKTPKLKEDLFFGARVYVTNDGFIGRPRLGKLSGALQAFSVSRIIGRTSKPKANHL